MISELEPMWKEAVPVNLKALFRHSSGGIEKNDDKFRAVSVPTEIRAAHLPNRKHKAPQPSQFSRLQ
jgi:hypothetical protein